MAGGRHLTPCIRESFELLHDLQYFTTRPTIAAFCWLCGLKLLRQTRCEIESAQVNQVNCKQGKECSILTVFSFSWPLAVAVQVDIAALATGQVAFMLASFTMAPWIAAS